MLIPVPVCDIANRADVAKGAHLTAFFIEKQQDTFP
jgi:hypothetical protein